MELSTNPKVWKSLILIIALLTFVFYVLFFFTTLLITLIVGVSLIVLTEQLRKYYKTQFDKRKYSKQKRRFYGILIILFWLLIIVFLVFTSIEQMTAALSNIEIGDGTSESSFNVIIKNKLSPIIPNFIENRINFDELIQRTVTITTSFLSSIVAGLTTFFIISVIAIPLMYYTYYKQKDEIFQRIFKAIPGRFKKSFLNAFKDTGFQLNAFLTGKIVQSVILAGIYCLGFYIVGVKGWLLWGVLAGLLNIIPYIGPIIGAIPPLLLTLLVDSSIIAVFVLMVIVIAQSIDNFYLQPFMLAGRVKIGPLLSIVLVIIGAQLYGILGMILAFPIYIVYKVVIKESYEALREIYEKPKKR